MKLTILSRSEAIPSTARLAAAAQARGHQVRVLDPVQVEMHLDGVSAHLYYHRRRLPGGDLVIPRIAGSASAYGLSVLNQYAMRGVPIMNGADAVARARNKMRCLQLLSANGVDIPATVMARNAADLRAMVKLVGGVPVLVKLLQGQEKRGVMVCESLTSLEATLEAVLGLGENIILQQYVRRSGLDVRVLVVGGEAIAAVQRRPRRNRLSHTLNRGAHLEAIEPTAAQRDAAVATARLVGLELAAVDLLDADGTPKVYEVNSSPALTEMEAATRLDLADRIIARAETLLAATRVQALAPNGPSRLPRAVPGTKASAHK